MLYSDEDELDDDELRAFASFPGMSPMQGGKGRGQQVVVSGRKEGGCRDQSCHWTS